ncbi:MAG: cation:proton antiporter [Piscinibacter sp.]|nr:cation:proton antiporter [Piscinibacter sp.]
MGWSSTLEAADRPGDRCAAVRAGTRIRPRWLLDNRWLAASCLLQSLLCGAPVTGAGGFGAPWLTAAVAGTVALSTSPVIVLATTHESRSRGQVTERLLLMAAVNAVIAVIGLKVLRIMLASDADSPTEEFTRASISALRVISGSFLLGVACGFALDRLSPLVRGTPAMPVLQIALVIIASMLAAQWTLSPLLALLVAGMTARAREARPHGGTPSGLGRCGAERAAVHLPWAAVLARRHRPAVALGAGDRAGATGGLRAGGRRPGAAQRARLAAGGRPLAGTAADEQPGRSAGRRHLRLDHPPARRAHAHHPGAAGHHADAGDRPDLDPARAAPPGARDQRGLTRCPFSPSPPRSR